MSSKKSGADLKISGLLNINKPQDITSRQVVDQVQKLIKPARVGHAGTLDPLATGVLVLCTGSNTRLIRLVQQQPKEYIGEFILGKRSDTDDITGEISETADCRQVTLQELETCLPAFEGRIQQIPPQYSAVHINGRRAYDLARRGKSFEIQPREVDVYEIELLDFSFPRFQLRIVCGSGTYIRSIGRDLGEQLGVGATMSALTRTRIGPFTLDSAMELDEELSLGTIADNIQPAILAVEQLPHYHCNERELLSLSQGQKLKCKPEYFPATHEIIEVAVISPQTELVAIADWEPEAHQLSPRQVFHPAPNN
ncbi:tRNA pseudouridine(55) synthase TruB [Gimesia maris]|jgi:tRNA pseudouridine55 synthase|uniref:tRNA pseudouridine synthase B n=1 Tax=Gimesia maris TaxID=122 RepID=A0A3D3RFC2_9PLAN|nr:tRNA pseudouridine(55) synthase TruB [Gimesia sp.]HCO27531.1 tRNA pseudouridine(55) synthase TruB [Gimesia maris]|tara:strand:- start:32433 stop:33365 length:933 start_codon:yes stop_codon:yes gene_type:complete